MRSQERDRRSVRSEKENKRGEKVRKRQRDRE